MKDILLILGVLCIALTVVGVAKATEVDQAIYFVAVNAEVTDPSTIVPLPPVVTMPMKPTAEFKTPDLLYQDRWRFNRHRLKVIYRHLKVGEG